MFEMEENDFLRCKTFSVYCKPESIELFIEEHTRHTEERLRKRDNLLMREGGVGGRGAKSYDRKTAWSSMNH